MKSDLNPGGGESVLHDLPYTRVLNFLYFILGHVHVSLLSDNLSDAFYLLE
jgi:hypothetical protein